MFNQDLAIFPRRLIYPDLGSVYNASLVGLVGKHNL